MKANFRALPETGPCDQCELDEHADYLAFITTDVPPAIGHRPPPPGYESFVTVDVLGAEFAWMNQALTSDRVTWYIWFESVFLVPGEMATFLKLRWP